MDPGHWTAGFGFDADLPQTVRKDPPGFHEAIWTWGYSPASRFGYYLYLLHDLLDDDLRHEVVVVYLPDGTILRGSASGRNSHGRTAAGHGLFLECVEPFQQWHTRYAGVLAATPWDGAGAPGDDQPCALEFGMRAATPAWDVEGDWGERPPNMRFHQLYRISDGSFSTGDLRVEVGGTAMRGHSRRERDNSAYTGHVVATALFDDGRAFGMFAFFGEGTRLRRPHGYVVLDGQRHEAIVEEVPLIAGRVRDGEPLRFALRGDFGRVEVTGETVVTTFGVRDSGPQAGLAVSMGIARYRWGAEVAYGPIDRCHSAATIPNR